MKIPLCKLSEKTRETLRKIQEEPQGVSFFQATSGRGGAIFGVVVAILGFLALIMFAIDEPPHDDYKPLYGGGTFLAALILIASVRHIRAYNRAEVRPFRALNPLYFFQVDWKNLSVHKMWALDDVQATHHLTNGVYNFTAFVLKFDDGSINFQITPKPRAEELLAQINASRGILQEAFGDERPEALVEYDIFGMLFKENVDLSDPDAPSPGFSLGWLNNLAFAVLLGALAVPGITAFSGVAFDLQDWDRYSFDVRRHLRYAVCFHEAELPSVMRRELVETWTKNREQLAGGASRIDSATDDSDDSDDYDYDYDYSYSDDYDSGGYDFQKTDEEVDSYNRSFGTELKARDILEPAAIEFFTKDWKHLTGAGVTTSPTQILEHIAMIHEFVSQANAKYGWGLTVDELTPHNNEIAEKINQCIHEAIDAYRVSATERGADAQAIQAMIKILESMTRQKRYTLTVAYSQSLEGDTELEDQFHELYPDYKKIAPMSPAFTMEKNLSREAKITGVLATAFEKLLDGLVKVSGEKTSDTAVTLRLEYQINPSDSVFYDEDEENILESDRMWYTGIYADWTLSFVLTSEQEPIYTAEQTSFPSERFEFPIEWTMYDGMAQSMFENFQVALEEHFGL